MLGIRRKRSALLEPQVWILGNSHPRADRSIEWDDQFPNLNDPDVIIVDLTKLNRDVLEKVDKEKMGEAQRSIRDKYYAGGTIIVITQPVFSIRQLPYIYSNYYVLPVEPQTISVPAGTGITWGRHEIFQAYKGSVESFLFYINGYEPRITRPRLAVLPHVGLFIPPGQSVTDRSGHQLGCMLTIEEWGRIEDCNPVRESGQMFLLPPPTRPARDAIGSILSVYRKTRRLQRPVPWPADAPSSVPPTRPALRARRAQRGARGPHEQTGESARGSAEEAAVMGAPKKRAAGGPARPARTVSVGGSDAVRSDSGGSGGARDVASGAVAAEPAASRDGADVFLSYSHEVKDSVAGPLAMGLEKRGVSVWWDKTAMKISDALHQKIREGISGARHGVVIVSRGYLDSDWGKTELGAMFGRGLQIFPILYGVSAEDAQAKLPAIAGKIMRPWGDSPESIMDEIANAVKDSRRGRPARSTHGGTPR